jgi:CSLREA domain-containing protein
MTTVVRPLHTAVSSPLRIDARRPRTAQRGTVGVALVALLIVTALGMPSVPAYAAGTITVNTPNDEYNVAANASCSLREAVQSANNNANFGGCILSGIQPFTISLGAGTFQLTIAGANDDSNATGDLDILASGTIIAGAGAASTTIQQTTADRVIDINPTVAASFSAGISNLRITGGNVGGNFGGGGIIYGDSNGGGTLTITGVTVDNNSATQGPGGGIASGARGNLTIIDSTISNNTASSPTAGGGASAGTGGGIDFLVQGPNQLTISNSTVSGNRAAYTADAGGGLHISGGTATIQRTHFVDNKAANAGLVATGSGGAIAHLGGTLDVSYSRFVDNAATSGSGIFQVAGGGTSTANDNWWGLNTGPAVGVLAGTAVPTATRWLQLRHSASPASIPASTSTTLTADLFGLNTGGSTAAANLAGLPPFPSPAGTIFSNAVLGTLSGAGTQFVSGQAGATYNAGGTPGAGSADAAADGQTVTANITIENTTAVGLTAFSGRSSSALRPGPWLLASGVLGLGGLWLARRRRQTAYVAAGDARQSTR